MCLPDLKWSTPIATLYRMEGRERGGGIQGNKENKGEGGREGESEEGRAGVGNIKRE